MNDSRRHLKRKRGDLSTQVNVNQEEMDNLTPNEMEGSRAVLKLIENTERNRRVLPPEELKPNEE